MGTLKVEVYHNPRPHIEKALEPTEKMVGAWLDETHPCGIVVITSTKKRLRTFNVCASGGATRLPDEAAGIADDLEPIPAPRGAKRA